MNILINDNTYGILSIKHKKIIFAVLKCALKLENIKSNPEISVYIVNNKEIQDLNKKFRNTNRPTDVLSFALIEFGDSPKDLLRKKNILLGDIVISIEKVSEQAKIYGHSIERELGFLTAHGILHLLGYDHIKVNDKKIMFDKQDRILAEIGLFR